MNGVAEPGEWTRRAESVLERFERLIRGLHLARGARQTPWADCPLTLPQLRALSLLAGRQQGFISRELAARLGVGPSAVTPLVDRLVEHGFVVRRDDPGDRRATHLVVTETGLAMLARMTTGQADLMRDILAHLTSADLDAVGHAFDLLLGGVQHVVTDGAGRIPEPARPLQHTSRKDPHPCTTLPT